MNTKETASANTRSTKANGTVVLDGNFLGQHRLAFNDAVFGRTGDDNILLNGSIYANGLLVWHLELIVFAHTGRYTFGDDNVFGTLYRREGQKAFVLTSGTLIIPSLNIERGVLHGELINVGAQEDLSFLITHGALDFE